MFGLFDRFLGFIENRSVRSALAAVMIATLLVLVITAVTSARYELGLHLQVSTPLQFILSITYLVLVVVVWTVLHSLSSDTTVDVYTDAAKRLVGPWAVSFEANIGTMSPRLVGTSRRTNCSFLMDRPDKLQFTLSTKNDPINAGVADLIIRDVALRYTEAGDFTMFYYYSGSVSIWPGISQYIVAEPENPKPDEVKIEFLGRVGFDRPAGNQPVKEMKGTWYDLNGNIARLLGLLNAQMAAMTKEEKFEPMKLSQMPVQQRSVAASMGSVHFTRE